MAGYLLDTNTFIWLTQDPGRLGPKAKKILTESRLYLSPISVFEIRVKISTGKLKLSDNVLQLISIHDIETIDLKIAQINNYKVFSQANRDPFDNALLTIAKQNKLKFITSDEKILKLNKSLNWIVDSRL